MEIFGKHRRRRNDQKRKEAVHVFGGFDNEFPIGLQNVCRLLQRPERWAELDHANRMQPELERSHYAEVSATPTNGPEQVIVLLRACRDESSVRKHHVDRQQVINREAIAARKVADASSHGESGNSGG